VIDSNGAKMRARPSTNSTFRGIKIDLSFECENACDSIRFNDDGDSNEIDESDLQCLKHAAQRISTEHGIEIDSSFEDENACDSIRFSDDGDSNEIEKSELKPENSDREKSSIEHGIQTCVIVKSPLHSRFNSRIPPTTFIRRM
jgi:hypothetical protein